MNWEIVGIVLLGLMVVVITFQALWIDAYKKKQKHSQELIRDLQKEQDLLNQLRDQDEYKDIRPLLERRASLIGRLMAAGISGDRDVNEAILKEIESLVADREIFMRENMQMYERWQPAMISHLRECGLTDEEMEVCCLYAMGLNGKSIQQYTQDGRHYQNVGLIRKKLGLGEHDKNIDGYIKSLIK